MQFKTRFYALLATAAMAFTAATPAQATAVPGQGTWETTLQARDLDGDGITDAFYDTTLNITWLRDANVIGDWYWSQARARADGYSIGIYDDWRLPTMVDTGTSGCNVGYAGTDCGWNVQTATSEMASLWYDTLGNKAYCPPSGTTCAGGPQTGWGLTNTGDFLNLRSAIYWTDLSYAPDSGLAWSFYTSDGFQDASVKGFFSHAMAVRPGDVASSHDVPEPPSLLLALTALAGLSLRRRPAPLRALST